MANTHDPQKIERRWKRIWGKIGIYKTLDRIKGKRNFYCLDMFPYPSGEGLHVGHLRGYIASDIIARYFRMKGFNCLHPMGFDAFGLPAENAAIKFGIHPRAWTYGNIKKMRKQLNSIGASYDWSREVITCDPDYYKWTQWMFLQLYKKGLAYRAKVPANWCPSCKTILANEQVIDGKCERCNSEVLQKEIEQWLFKITKYADALLKDLKDLDWPETTKIMQKNWIGRSEGWVIRFNLKSQISNLKNSIKVFTTRTDTLFGATYLVLAPEHPIIKNLKSRISNFKYVERYIEESKKKTERERISEVKEKTGIELRGIKAVNPVNDREIPIFVADYVLIHYGTGAIMAVPAHDQRDFDFAKKYNLPIINVIKPEFETPEQKLGFAGAYEDEGILINSGRFTGMRSIDAKERIGKFLAKRKMAKRAVYYKLRDWVVSRQRYWGAPIPMVFCRNCGWQPVPEKDLPVLLPKIKDFWPTAEGRSPLAKIEKFVKTSCPKCQGSAQRETDTLDTFVCSAWYYFRYTDPKNEKKFALKEKIKTWLPVDIYVGGAEHAVGHLLYSRFLTKFLKKINLLDFPEPFLKLRHPGIILGPDHQKMSKSRGNIVAPETVIEKYGVDTLRLYEMFMGPLGETMPWDPKGIVGCYRFLEKVYKLKSKVKPKTQNLELEKLIHKTIKKVTEDIENFRLNTAISALMILVNEMQKEKEIQTSNFRLLTLLLAPFAPHLSEQLWQEMKVRPPKLRKFKIRDSIHVKAWPRYIRRLVEEKIVTLILQVNGKVRDKIEVETDISEKKAKALAISREKIKKWIEGKEIKKVVFVPGKLINIVV